MPDTQKPDAAVGFDILKQERLHDGWMKLDRFTVRQHLMRGGTTPPITREVAVGGEVSALIPYDPVLNQVVLIEQARLPAQLGGFHAFSTEIVAGLIEPGENPVEVAIRETREETGCRLLAEPLPIARIMLSQGNLHQPIHLFCGRVDASTALGFHGVAEEHEEIRVVVLDIEAFRAEINAGRYENGSILVAGYWLLANLESLRARWA
jgi:ADP-ribose pyrophosphatase